MNINRFLFLVDVSHLETVRPVTRNGFYVKIIFEFRVGRTGTVALSFIVPAKRSGERREHVRCHGKQLRERVRPIFRINGRFRRARLQSGSRNQLRGRGRRTAARATRKSHGGRQEDGDGQVFSSHCIPSWLVFRRYPENAITIQRFLFMRNKAAGVPEACP